MNKENNTIEKQKKYTLSKKRLFGLTLFGIILSGCLCLVGYRFSHSPKRTVTISIGDIPDKENKPVEYELYMKSIEDFENKNSDIKIEPIYWQFSPKEYRAKAEGGTLPDVYMVPMTENSKIINMGYAADITEKFKERGYLRNTSEFIMKRISKDGRVYFVPSALYDVGIAVNIDILTRAGLIEADGTPKQPQTWEELNKKKKKIKEKTNIAGFAAQSSSNAGGWRFTPIAWSYGTVFETKSQDGTVRASFNTKECAEALGFVRDLKWKYDVLPTGGDKMSNFNVQKEFAAGNVGMIFAETGTVINVVGYGMKKDNIGLIKMPSGPKRRVTLVGGSYYVINKDVSDEQVEAAFRWIEYITGNSMILNDDTKSRVRDKISYDGKIGAIVGIKSLNPWNDNCDLWRYRELVEYEESNININHIKLYNNKEEIEFQTEEETEAQALYNVLDDCVYKVLTDENADIPKILEEANEEFQVKYLDYAN